jgi:hypothetical protein
MLRRASAHIEEESLENKLFFRDLFSETLYSRLRGYEPDRQPSLFCTAHDKEFPRSRGQGAADQFR